MQKVETFTNLPDNQIHIKGTAYSKLNDVGALVDVFIDTGANTTCISSMLASSLGLWRDDNPTVIFQTAAGDAEAYKGRIDLKLYSETGAIKIKDFPTYIHDTHNLDCDIILGLDVLRMFKFSFEPCQGGGKFTIIKE